MYCTLDLGFHPRCIEVRVFSFWEENPCAFCSCRVILFSFLRDFGEVFLTGGEKGIHLAGFKLALLVLAGGVGRRCICLLKKVN